MFPILNPFREVPKSVTCETRETILKIAHTKSNLQVFLSSIHIDFGKMGVGNMKKEEKITLVINPDNKKEEIIYENVVSNLHLKMGETIFSSFVCYGNN